MPIAKIDRHLKSPAVVNIDYRCVRRSPRADGVGWLFGYQGGVAVAADSTISPSLGDVEFCP